MIEARPRPHRVDRDDGRADELQRQDVSQVRRAAAGRCHAPLSTRKRSCRRCARGSPKRLDAEPIRHQVWDLPEIEPLVNEYRLHRAKCEVCGETTCATVPEGMPKGAFGPGVQALASTLVADGHMSRRKVVGCSATCSGSTSLGALSEAEASVSSAVAPAVEEARVEALAEHVKHLDATT